MYGRVLCHDRDAALTLEVHRVHDAIDDRFVLAERPGLPQHGIDKRRLAVINVGDNCNISNVFVFRGSLTLPATSLHSFKFAIKAKP